MRVNATDLFERYMYDEIYDDVIPPSLPSLKISEISFGQTIEAPLSLTDKLIISGNVRYGTYKDIARLHSIILVIVSLALKMAQEQDQLDVPWKESRRIVAHTTLTFQLAVGPTLVPNITEEYTMKHSLMY